MMAWGPEFTRQEVLQAVEARSRERWGEERLAALGPTMRALADALWLLSQQSLAPTDEAPDFLSDIADIGLSDA